MFIGMSEIPTIMPQSSATQIVAELPLQSISSAYLPYPQRITRRIVWRYALPIVTIHVLALAACFSWFFSWSGAALLWFGIYFYGGLGIDLCYHRLLTHRSFKTPLWLEHCLVMIAICCLEDAPASWVATHRQHHNDSDHQEDPHSPLVNFLWSHIGWLFVENGNVRTYSAFDKYARDILRDPFYMRLQRSMLPLWIFAAHAFLYFAAGVAVGAYFTETWGEAVQLGMSWLVWGCLLRTVCVWHISWSVNSLTHVFGYRSFNTEDNSRNNWLVAVLTSGEGWHNNHHHDPASANNGLRWWEFDLIYVCIQCLELCGLATQVIRPRQERLAKHK
jgi:fatty-acid desaturase